MKSFINAIQFLTPIHISSRAVEPSDLARSMRWFPLVGLGIGLFLMAVNTLVAVIGLSHIVTATFLLLALTSASGALHIDGLADMCDGFYAGHASGRSAEVDKTREEIVKVMRDPHIGVMGVLGIVFILLIKWGVLISLLSLTGTAYINKTLILAPLLSRWTMVVATAFGPYAEVAGSGTGRAFAENIFRKDWAIASVITLVAAVALTPIIGFLLMLVALITVVTIVLVARRVLGGVTGDIIGAMSFCSALT
ncbi:MAG: adenosylcobinamide-GDP ribazoletransferase [Planctomycetes bacterium]|nr:adenosylcobinamide-GDP ribazoletransferase [Planctomycetota bacterium]